MRRRRIGGVLADHLSTAARRPFRLSRGLLPGARVEGTLEFTTGGRAAAAAGGSDGAPHTPLADDGWTTSSSSISSSLMYSPAGCTKAVDVLELRCKEKLCAWPLGHSGASGANSGVL